MKTVTSQEVLDALDFDSLIGRLRDAFRTDVEAPLRSHYSYRSALAPDNSLLLMPAWQEGGCLGIKLVTVNPANPARGRPLVSGSYLLLDADTGELLALMDAPALTARRTAAASALASSFLSRSESRTLLMVGSGALAPHLVQAHATVRKLEAVSVWSRNHEKAQRLAEALRSQSFSVKAIEELEPAARRSDIISCATPSREPLIAGEWLRPGTHLDLVGSFAPGMREADSEALLRSRVFVDTRPGALRESGELLHAIETRQFHESDVQGDLHQLCRREVSGRSSLEEITLFKSVGTALEDLAAAQLVFQRLG